MEIRGLKIKTPIGMMSRNITDSEYPPYLSQFSMTNSRWFVHVSTTQLEVN